jgi:CBS domain containing-hemolysin-like protein
MLGVVQAKDLLDAYLHDERPDIRAQVRPAPNVPDTADALDVVDVIKRSPVHIALVHDEYGHFEGVVTNADILEAIVDDGIARASPKLSEIARTALGLDAVPPLRGLQDGHRANLALHRTRHGFGSMQSDEVRIGASKAPET